ncbi:MAG: replication-associated recombination protein A [bacterium]|nr:MAG: replication-associated recombination protein A [bacterium]
MSTGDLFPEERFERAAAGPGPLADRMRPAIIEEFVGQEELMGTGAILRRMIEEDQLASVIFWGPPGSGKTTLARLIADKTGSMFMSYSAVTSGSKEMKEVMAAARELRRRSGRRTILFVDEVHRFNKAQQDAFLPYVESGDVILIGATTENPSFEVNAALLSRSKVFVFRPLGADEIRTIVQRAIARDEELNQMGVTADGKTVDYIVSVADGDARRALNALEMAAILVQPDEDGHRTISAGDVRKAVQSKSLAYDKGGEEHYNIISALHKSIRGSDPDASLYWLARMMEAGEDRRFLLRRLARAAVEDVGMADPEALVQAAAARQAFDFVGEPEGDLIIAQLTVYLAMAPKSNALYTAYGRVLRDVRETEARGVPLHIRNAPTRLMRDQGYAKGYEYSHDMPEGLSLHSFFPEEMGERRYYSPSPHGKEREIRERLKELRGKIRRLRERGGERESGGGGEND